MLGVAGGLLGGSGRAPRLLRMTAALAAALLVAAVATTRAVGSSRSVVAGRVEAGARPVVGSMVVLFAAGGTGRVRLGSARTGSRGGFRIAYRRPSGNAVLYVVASGGRRPAGTALQMMTVAGSAASPPASVTVNELTTVGAAYALAQFAHGTVVRGGSPGLQNAGATAANLVDPVSGTVSSVLARAPNGADTDTLATLISLSRIVAGCAQRGPAGCGPLFVLARPPRGPRPSTTLQAILDIARNPVHNTARLFALSRADGGSRGLRAPPSAWVLSLVYTTGGFDGPGRIAIDSRGDVWSTNNFQPPGTAPGLGLVVLSPTGVPIDHSPVTGGGLQGAWWGIAIDRRDDVWVSSYTGADPNPPTSRAFVGGKHVSEFTGAGAALSPPSGFSNGGINAPQGVAVDESGNVWIANHGANSVTEYPHGDPSAARVITGGGISQPFAVATDARGRVWVSDNALSAAPGAVSEISPSGRAFGPIRGGGLRSPQGIAIDQAGNLWVADFGSNSLTEIAPDGRVRRGSPIRAPSLRGPWGVAVDGGGNVWVASFLGRTLTELCGVRRSLCPVGKRTGQVISPPVRGFTNGGLEHLTSVQVDPSGNVWVANNWKTLKPVVGGNGLVEFIGLATPVRTPLIGPPRRP